MAGHHHTEVVDLLRLAHDGEIAGITIEGDRLEAQIHKGLIHRLLPDLRRDTGGKVLQGGSHIDELAGFALLRLEEMAIHQLPFQISHLEPTVTLTGGLTVLKPVLEALSVEIVGLSIDALVVERGLQRRLQVLHLERQPATGARRVVEELLVIARAAKRGDMGSPL